MGADRKPDFMKILEQKSHEAQEKLFLLAQKNQEFLLNDAVRPFMRLRPEIMRKGTGWCVNYGSVFGGVTAYGDTPEMASREFDRIWLEGEAEPLKCEKVKLPDDVLRELDKP